MNDGFDSRTRYLRETRSPSGFHHLSMLAECTALSFLGFFFNPLDSVIYIMQPVLLSTFMFIPNGQADVIRISFYLSDHAGLWDIDRNHVYVNHAVWSQWRDCRNNQPAQKKFFDSLRRVSNTLLT